MDFNSRQQGTIVSRNEGAIQTYMAQVYGWMTVGLMLTAFVAWYVSQSAEILSFIFSSKITFFGLVIAQLGLVVALSSMVHRLSGAAATAMFMGYSALTGVTLSSIFVVYTSSSIASTFAIAALTFGAMSVYGYTTKRDLSKLGSMMFMGLIGIVIASIVNIFMNSDAVSWAITYIGVIVFVGLTIYDTQKLRMMGDQLAEDDSENMRRYSIMGALTLYLDFINLFLMLLRIFGDRR